MDFTKLTPRRRSQVYSATNRLVCRASQVGDESMDFVNINPCAGLLCMRGFTAERFVSPITSVEIVISKIIGNQHHPSRTTRH